MMKRKTHSDVQTEVVQGERMMLPLQHLSLSPLNVRKTPPSAAGIESLAAMIQADGILENLIVYAHEQGKGAKRTTHAVIAGGRRWRALRLLLDRGALTPDSPVPVLVVTEERAKQISLEENEHEALHPADEFEAFKELVDQGSSVEEIAAGFGVEPIVVERRLKLARVAPKFIEMYRNQEIRLEQLMALTVTDDHERQITAWETLQYYQREPVMIRRALTEGEVAATDPIARFVGLKAYQKAGGGIRRDLFVEDDEGFLTDTALLMRLADEKLKRAKQKVEAEGHAWVEASPTREDWSLNSYARVQPRLREATPEEQAALDEITAERAQLEETEAQGNEDDESTGTLEDRVDELGEREAAIKRQREVIDPDEQAASGAILSIDRRGKLHIERGLLKPDDAKRLRAAKGATSSEFSLTPRSPHSAVLIRRLTAQLTLACQAALADNPDIALVAMTHCLAEQTFCHLGSNCSPMQITRRAVSPTQYGEEIKKSRAHEVLERMRESWGDRLPGDSASLFEWLLEQSREDLLALMAYCAATSLDGVQDREGASELAPIAKALKLDMADWWTATAETYLSSVARAHVLEVLKEAVSPEAAGPLQKAKMPKDALVRVVQDKLSGKRWLPKVLQIAA